MGEMGAVVKMRWGNEMMEIGPYKIFFLWKEQDYLEDLSEDIQ